MPRKKKKSNSNRRPRLPKEIKREAREGNLDPSRIFHLTNVQLREEDLTRFVANHTDDYSSTDQVRQNVQQRMSILSATHQKFEIYPLLYKQSNMEFERDYRALWEDLKQEEGIWFHVIFANEDNYVYVERTTGILGTLCTILRQRGALQDCMDVMKMYTKVLERYQEICFSSDDPPRIVCCKVLTHKYSLIRLNCGLQLYDKAMMIKSIKDIVKYEKQAHLLGIDREWIVVLGLLRLDVDTASDDEIVRVLYKACDVPIPEDVKATLDESTRSSTKATASTPLPAQNPLRTCGCCKSTEEMFGDYKFCKRCNKMPYCGRDCQAKDWKIHKVICGTSNTTNVDSATLRSVAETLVKNFTTTVETHGHGPISEEQQRSLLKGLLKLFKQLLAQEKFARFNTNFGFGDGGTDVEVNKEICKFVSEQDGFEAWKEIAPGYLDRLRKEAEESSSSGGFLRTDPRQIRLLAQSFSSSVVRASSGMRKDQMEEMTSDFEKIITDYILENPEYNCLGGIERIGNDEKFIERMSEYAADKAYAAM